MKCPCHSEKTYENCCRPYHNNEKKPPTPLALMRSRYSAYALNLPDYIIDTTHPDHPDSKTPRLKRIDQITVFCKSVQFVGLEILDTTETPPTVTFRAHLMQHNKDLSFTEKSLFASLNGRWLYLKPLSFS